MAGRYRLRDADPLTSLPPEHFIFRVNQILNRLLAAFLLLTISFAALTSVLSAVAPQDVNQFVWGRVIAELIIAGVFFFYAYLWRKGRFWGYWRLLTTSGWGALVVASIIALPGKYPVWVRLEQVAQLFVLAWLFRVLSQSAVRKHFAKKH